MNGSAVSGPDLRGTALVILFCFPMTSAAQAVERPHLVEELLTGERVPRWSFHAALIEPWRAWRGVLEIEASEKGSSTLTPGVIWHVPALEVGIGCPLGLSHDAPSGVIVKVTKEFQF
jgi:hypothetical protein